LEGTSIRQRWLKNRVFDGMVVSGRLPEEEEEEEEEEDL
jgi:hypothetical protein